VPSTSARTAPRLSGRAAGALALVCLALGAGRAPAQDDFGPARQPATPSPFAAPPRPPGPDTPSVGIVIHERAQPAAPPDGAPSQDDFGPARQPVAPSPVAAPLPQVIAPPAGAASAAPEKAPPQDLFRPARPQAVPPRLPAPPAEAVGPEPARPGGEPAGAAGANLVAALQRPPGPAPIGDLRPTEEAAAAHIQLEPPGPERLFRLDSEARLQERIRQEGRDRTPVDIVVFPKEPVLSTEPYYGRRWPTAHEYVEPNYLCYRRLLFEQKSFERYGWDLGVITPIVSALDFFGDFILMPYHGFTDPCRCFECNAGYCLPGDPVPLLLYPCEPSVTGALAEAATVAAVLAIFP
jgi:hypothetical protein